MPRTQPVSVLRRRRFAYAAAGALLSLGAPVGLLLLRLGVSGIISPDRLATEIGTDVQLYAYVTVSTAVAFTLFGGILGREADRLEALATTDALTELENARALRDHLRRELSRAARYHQPVALLLIDVDGLKAINDRFGHAGGDRALRHVGEAIRRELRESDVGARWGGDEFALLAPSTSARDAAALADRLRSLVSHRPAGRDVPQLTISVGIAGFDGGTDHAPDPVMLMRDADQALYDAKRAGRDRYVIAGSGDLTGPTPAPHRSPAEESSRE